MFRRKKKLEITICMGSSCFSRGSRDSLEVLQKYLEEEGLEEKVDLRGALCMGNCKKGPNMVVSDEEYENVTPGTVVDIVKHHLERK
ncbi:NADP-reducing hydrogenase subunit HndA [Anaerohalosphaera lusitana]|uniref:NADP-reducing hydrogenase subunit HndA n=2 Tax=Anaerohalosphaera lusitana TaxID=1936003 RepID=A0A1U9NM36_9BACT|nr:NADP-reducing hydrogenase subunit HndA [Anaerohalosphaera lusitana]